MTIGHLFRCGRNLLEARELRFFLALAEELHFGRAARRLAISAPVLSRTVHRLESDLGVALFVRDTHEVRLTTAGRVLVGRTRDALAGLDEALAATREAGRRELEGALSVGVTPLMRHRLGPAIFEHFGKAYPLVRVARHEELSGPMIEELLARRIDLALAFCPPRHPGLFYESIRDAELVLLVAQSHPFAGRSTVHPSTLHNETLLLPSIASAPAVRERFAALFKAVGFQPRYSDREIDYDQEMTAVRDGHGVVLISRFFFETEPQGTTLLALNPPVPLSFELVRRVERPTPMLTRFTEVVRATGVFDSQTLWDWDPRSERFGHTGLL
jgi:DNA-binding transcriptional LysR family regulator